MALYLPVLDLQFETVTVFPKLLLHRGFLAVKLNPSAGCRQDSVLPVHCLPNFRIYLQAEDPAKKFIKRLDSVSVVSRVNSFFVAYLHAFYAITHVINIANVDEE